MVFLRAAAILWPGRAFARKGHLEWDGALLVGHEERRAVVDLHGWMGVDGRDERSPWCPARLAIEGDAAWSGRGAHGFCVRGALALLHEALTLATPGRFCMADEQNVLRRPGHR